MISQSDFKGPPFLHSSNCSGIDYEFEMKSTKY